VSLSRRALLVVLAALPLAACGKRGAPLPPPGDDGKPSDFPHPYPALKNYPHPELGGGGKTKQDSPPEQQKPTQQDGSDVDTSTPGLYP
jgi:hypothetical protein